MRAKPLFPAIATIGEITLLPAESCRRSLRSTCRTPISSPRQSKRVMLRRSAIRVDDRDRRDGNDELRAPFTDMAHLLHDFILEVPRQDQDVVRLGLVDRFHREDRNVHARRVAAVLVRVAIDREIQEIGADNGVVEERGALSRGAAGADAASGPPWLY